MRRSRLPDNFEPRPGAVHYQANDMIALHRLAWRMRKLAPIEKCHLAAMLIDMRVMWPSLPLRAMIAFARWHTKYDDLGAMVYAFRTTKRGTRLADVIVENAACWAVSGIDKLEPDSIGGFCQDELDFISGAISLVQEIVAAWSVINTGTKNTSAGMAANA